MRLVAIIPPPHRRRLQPLLFPVKPYSAASAWPPPTTSPTSTGSSTNWRCTKTSPTNSKPPPPPSPPLSFPPPLLRRSPPSPPSSSSSPPPHFPPSHNPHFTPLLKSIHLHLPVHDEEEDIFRCGGATVAGYVMFFPNYSTYLAKPGFYVQNIYVRECYRRKGMGNLLLSAVAAQAAEMGWGRVKWVVADWNVDAIMFYERMGAQILPGKTLCRLTGEALQAYALFKT